VVELPSFTQRSSYRELQFPRAPGYASLNATTAAAKRLHDERIGKRRCAHLFRLALADEVSIQRAIQLNGRVFLEPAFQRREDALGALEAESREVISVDAGPVQIGSLDDAFTELGLSELAKHYFAAFRQEIQSLPYFREREKMTTASHYTTNLSKARAWSLRLWNSWSFGNRV